MNRGEPTSRRDRLFAGRALGQHSVFVRYPHGVVAILEVDKVEVGLSRGGPIPTGEEPRKRPHDASIGDIWETRDGSIVAFTSFHGYREAYLFDSLLKRGYAIAMAVGGTVSHYRQLNGAFDRDRRTDHPLELSQAALNVLTLPTPARRRRGFFRLCGASGHRVHRFFYRSYIKDIGVVFVHFSFSYLSMYKF